ncbi:uncharacterized protein LOC114246617 isoform X2 [Bombyx mandarina]|uniref:Uncharacterized protein LOC114246617 isoform X2 n=1 Tax=Bombyx mandarina TaxID=7092 RepID=A0A6J2JZK6_BOMMA|nr:uncharacterized protein LOC114246617 isoform X2 [Bombyx mandarina]
MYIHERRYVISGRQRDPQTEGGSFTARNCSPTEMIAGNDAAATSETHEAHPSQAVRNLFQLCIRVDRVYWRVTLHAATTFIL